MEDRRDASDAAHDLNGRELKGNRISVEIAKGTPHGRDRFADAPRPYNQPTYGGRGGGGFRGFGGRSDYGRGGGDYRDRGRPAAPDRSAYRVSIENLASGASWQELKNFMRQAGDVVFADVDIKRNEGIVEFASSKDMQRAIDKLDGIEFLGRKIRMTEKRRSSSRRRSPSRRSRSRSRTRSRGRSHSSRSSSRSRSRSDSRGKAKNGTRSPARKSSERSNDK
uniref:RRM domain-containing protein n=1 Tax=Romanomermis culicivorax TaxID=13658 RepID=A0A915IIF5_ROMCU